MSNSEFPHQVRSAESVVPRARFVALFFFALLGTLSCVSVPEEVVVLSSAVGDELAESQAAHEVLLQSRFDLIRDRIEAFLTDKWIPEFTGRFFEESDLLAKLESPEPFTTDQIERLRAEISDYEDLRPSADNVIEVVERAWGDAWRAEQAMLFTMAAVEEIEAQRQELLAPVDVKEREALHELRQSSVRLIEMQAAVTAYLRAARKASVEQDAMLRQLGVIDERNELIEEAALASDRIAEITAQAESADRIVQEILEFFGTKEPPGQLNGSQ